MRTWSEFDVQDIYVSFAPTMNFPSTEELLSPMFLLLLDGLLQYISHETAFEDYLKSSAGPDCSNLNWCTPRFPYNTSALRVAQVTSDLKSNCWLPSLKLFMNHTLKPEIPKDLLPVIFAHSIRSNRMGCLHVIYRDYVRKGLVAPLFCSFFVFSSQH